VARVELLCPHKELIILYHLRVSEHPHKGHDGVDTSHIGYHTDKKDRRHNEEALLVLARQEAPEFAESCI
jgi:hypothetical protein